MKNSIKKFADSITEEWSNSNFFNDYDFQIIQLQFEIESKISEREKRAKLLLNECDTQLSEFTTRWFEEIADASSMDIEELEHGIRVSASSSEGSTFRICQSEIAIEFKYLQKSYKFKSKRCDEVEDIDIQDFVTRSHHIDKDELKKITIVFNELESLFSYLMRWNREMVALLRDLQLKVIRINLELRDVDNEIEFLREKIHELRSASFLAGNIIYFKDYRKSRRFYYNSNKFEFTDQVKLVSLSASRKTCTFEAIVYEKRTGYHSSATRDSEHLETFQKVRVATLLANFSERKSGHEPSFCLY